MFALSEDRYLDWYDPDDMVMYWKADEKPVKNRCYYPVGSRVRVIEQTKYKYDLVNKIGTVRSIHQSNIAVSFDEVKNESSNY